MSEILAAVIIKVAYLISGLVVCFIGKSMLEKGITADFHGEGEIASRKLRIVTSSPGIVFLLAGLAVLVVGIRHETSVDPEGGLRLGRASPAVTQVDPAVIIGQLRAVNRATPAEENARANNYYDQAVRCEQREGDAQCLELLLKATAIDPNLMARVQDSPLLQKHLENPVFREYAAARVRIYLEQSGGMRPLSTSAKGLLARIAFLASQWPEEQTSNKGIDVAQTRLAIGVADAALIEALVTVLKANPPALHRMLAQPDNVWAVENDAVQLALSQAMDQINANAFTLPQEAEQ